MRIKIDEYAKIRMTAKATEILTKFGVPYMTPDFVGYILTLPNRYKTAWVTSIGEFGFSCLVSTKKQVSPSKREYIKSIKYLIKKGVLEVDPEEPFDEYRAKLGFDSGMAILVKDAGLAHQSELRLRGTPNDSLDGIGDFWKED